MENRKSLIGALVALVAVIAIAAVGYNALAAQGANPVPELPSSATSSPTEAATSDGEASGAQSELSGSEEATNGTGQAESSASIAGEDTVAGDAAAGDAVAGDTVAGDDAAGDATAETAPVRFADFAISTLDGSEVKLSSFEGKPTLLGFWATWCPPCNTEAPEIQKLYDTYGDQVNFVMVDAASDGRDSREIAASWVEENGYTYPVYVDETGDAARETQVYYLPTMYVLDKDGNILTAFSGAITEESGGQLIEQLLAM